MGSPMIGKAGIVCMLGNLQVNRGQTLHSQVGYVLGKQTQVGLGAWNLLRTVPLNQGLKTRLILAEYILMWFCHVSIKYFCLLFVYCCFLLGCFFMCWLMCIILKFSSALFPGLLVNVLCYIWNISTPKIGWMSAVWKVGESVFWVSDHGQITLSPSCPLQRG